MGAECEAGGAGVPAFWRVHLVQVVGLFEAILLTSAKMYRIPSFCPLSRFVLGALSSNVALFRVLRAFLARFMGFVWVCVGLVLFVACGAFVRVWS